MDEPRASQRDAPRRPGSPSMRAASAASSATAREWPRSTATSGRRSRRCASSAASKRSPESTTASAGSASITVVPGADRVEPGEDRVGVGAQQRRRSRGRTGARCARCASSIAAARRLRRDARPRRTPRAARAARRAGSASPSSPPGQPRPSQRSYEAPRLSRTPSGSPSCSASAARDARRAAATTPSISRWPETANSSPTRRRCSGGLPAPRRRTIDTTDGERCAASWPYFVAFRRDVVAEPLRLLVRVGVAADVDEQRRVVDDRALLLVEPEALREAQRDQALPQHVLHRLAEAEVDTERERGQQLRQADLRAIPIVAHAQETTLRGPSADHPVSPACTMP